MDNWKKTFFDISPEKYADTYYEHIKKINYNRAKIFSVLLVIISALMYIIAAFLEKDIQFIINVNLIFFIASIINAILFRIKIFKGKYEEKFKKILIYLLLFTVVAWSSSLLAFVPNRYELIGTYSIVILSISGILYLKWYSNLLIYFFSLLYVSIFINSITAALIPNIAVLLFLLVFSWIISRLLYYKEMQNFVINKELNEQKKLIQNEVLRKSNQLKEYEDNKVEEIILSITKLLDIYDPYTIGHSENVAVISRRLAEKMNLSNESIKDAYWAGMVHDIGKLLIPITIINKKGSLTEQEYNEIKMHPSWGFDVLNNSTSLRDIAKYVLYHHERWDGSGYPDGLVNNEIPLIAQILAVADAWDAMTSTRSYRNALTREKALEEIKYNSGKQFSPEVVKTFLLNRDELLERRI